MKYFYTIRSKKVYFKSLKTANYTATWARNRWGNKIRVTRSKA